MKFDHQWPCLQTTITTGVLAMAVALITPAMAAEQTYGVVHNLADHPSITALSQGLEDEAKNYDVELIMLDPAMDASKQASMIENLITRQVDAILINAVDPVAVVASMKKAHDAGIPVIMHNANSAAEGWQYSETYVGAAYIDQGRTLGKMIVEDTDGEGKVVILAGNPGQDASDERIQGALEAFEDTGLEVMATQHAEWQKSKALVAMEDLLTRFPEIDVVIGVDDPMALGALEAIKAAGRLDQIKIYGVNGNKEAFDAIKAGEMQGTVLQLSYLFGVHALRAAYDVTHGRLVAERINVPLAGVSQANIDQWYEFGW